MQENYVLSLICAYYLSKYDKVAYRNLGFSTSTSAIREIGKILGVNLNSVKNMRDEFDPIHGNPRIGWHQRPLRPSRVKVVEAFQGLDEEELRDVIIDILTNPSLRSSEDFSDILQSISKREKKKISKTVYVLRGPTGRKAEEFFIKLFKEEQKPIPGSLIDKRDYGCGYDFEIQNEQGLFQVEVKGLEADYGGVAFTSKEWDVAGKNGNTYFLAVVRNISSTPEIQFIRNPVSVLNPKKSIFTTVQVRWNLTETDLLESK